MSEEMSKSAKKRAAAKARAAPAEPAPAPAPTPAPKAEPKAKAKADAKPKAEPKAEPKAKAKAKAEAKAAEPKAEPKAAPKAKAAEPKAKAAGKAGAKKKAEPAPAPEPVKKKEEENFSHLQMDDGQGDSWEVATAVSKKAQRQKDRKDDGRRMTKEEKAVESVNQTIPGMAAPAVVVAKVSQAVGSTGVKAAVAEAKPGEAAPAEKLDSSVVHVPEAKIGRVIGPKGANLKIIQEKTGIARIDTNGEEFTISGDKVQVAAAVVALTELVEKGYMSLAFDNFNEIGCMAHPSTFPDIIGSKGAIIIALKEALKVEINIPPVPKAAQGAEHGPKKYKIGIAGSKEASEKAQKCIEDIIMYGHSEITHPGMVHEEIEVPTWAYAFIIGKGGSELKHIQKNWSVKVNIPRTHSANENVVVVGEPKDVARAKEYIEKQVYNAENQVSGRDKSDKAEDYWGKEEDAEPWMSQYMYKRK